MPILNQLELNPNETELSVSELRNLCIPFTEVLPCYTKMHCMQQEITSALHVLPHLRPITI